MVLVLMFCFAAAVYAQNEPYALGADISFMQQREREGVKYYRNGQVNDLLAILKESGFNYIRLRLFVDPTAEVTEAMNETECKNGGWCAAPYSRAGYCGLDSTIKIAKRVKAAGMKFLLDFHYSDTWADPGKQYKPMSWRGLSSSQLTERVRSYTKESLEKFKNNDALPDMVQVGNEVVGGMIHPDGNGNTQNFARLVNAGINGVKDVDPNIKIMIHSIAEFKRNPNAWFTTLKNNLNAVEANAANKIDVHGLSYYPRWHGTLDTLEGILTSIANTHNIKISVVEYADKHREVNDLVFNLPSNKGFGTFVWEPQEFEGDNSLPLFDWKSGANSGRHSNTRLELYPQMAIDYGTNASSSSIRSSSSSMPSSSSNIQSSSSSIPSSSSNIQSSSSSTTTTLASIPQIKKAASLMLADKTIILENLPPGTKVEVYNLQGKQINSTNSGNSQILRIQVAKGIYIVKVTLKP
jgi:arabinogalactan endo-1,4-beta-galactosidase